MSHVLNNYRFNDIYKFGDIQIVQYITNDNVEVYYCRLYKHCINKVSFMYKTSKVSEYFIEFIFETCR